MNNNNVSNHLKNEKRPVLVCQFKANGSITYVNEGFCHYYDLNKEDLISHNFFQQLHEADQNKIKHCIGRLNVSNPIEKFISHPAESAGKNDSQEWMVNAIFNSEGTIIEYLVVIRDVTNKVKAEDALRIERDNFINILNSMTDGIYIVDRNYDIEFINTALKDEFGPVKGRKCFNYFHGKQDVCHWCKNQSVFEGKTVRWNWESPKTGKIYDLMDTPLIKPDGSISKLEIFRDITELKKAEEAVIIAKQELEQKVKERTAELLKSKNLLQAVFNGISDPLFLVGMDMSVNMLNEAAKKYYNLNDEKDFKGKPCFAAFRGISTPCEQCKIPDAIGVSEKKIFERKGFMTPNRVEEVTIYPLESDNSKTQGAIIRINDITEIKTTQKRLLQNEKLSALGLLISGISHEINNPNNILILNIPTLRQYLSALIIIIDDYLNENSSIQIDGMSYPEFKKEIFELIDDVEYGSQKIDACLSRLKNYIRSRNEPNNQWVHPGKLIEEGVSICQSEIEKCVKNFAIDIAPDLPEIYTDPDSLIQVIVSLLMNAIQALDKKDSRIKIHAINNLAEKKLSIGIRDNGCGMDKKTKSKVFDPFFTTKSSQSGTGMGLYITHSLAERLKGHIEIESQPREGSIFKIVLPIDNREP